MATKKSEGVEIQIMEVQQGRLRVNVVGTSPILLNRMSEKAKRQLLLPPKPTNRADRNSRLKHVPLEEFNAEARRPLRHDHQRAHVRRSVDVRRANDGHVQLRDSVERHVLIRNVGQAADDSVAKIRTDRDVAADAMREEVTRAIASATRAAELAVSLGFEFEVEPILAALQKVSERLQAQDEAA